MHSGLTECHRLVVEKRLIKDVAEEIAQVRRGLHEIVCPSTLSLLTASEICSALRGNIEINVSEVNVALTIILNCA